MILSLFNTKYSIKQCTKEYPNLTNKERLLIVKLVHQAYVKLDILNRLVEKNGDIGLEKEIDNLHKNHIGDEWGVDNGKGTLEFRVMKHAHDNGFNTLESAYRDLMWNKIIKKKAKK